VCFVYYERKEIEKERERERNKEKNRRLEINYISKMKSLPQQQQEEEKDHSQQPSQPHQSVQQQQLIPETSEIKRLDDDTVRRITAEQAISDLASIVKELIDNSLDAESTTIKSKSNNIGPFIFILYTSSSHNKYFVHLFNFQFN
jgi:hypothetical protein